MRLGGTGVAMRGHGSRQSAARGSVAVEAALVVPLLLACVFAIVDAGIMTAAHAAWGAAARSAARAASALPRETTFASAATAAVAAAAGLRRGSALQEVWVYRANVQGFPGADGVTGFSDCATACLRYAYNPTARSFRVISGSWPPTAIAACAPQPDLVGVRVLARLDSLAGGIRAGPSSVDERAVFSFEPFPPSRGACR